MAARPPATDGDTGTAVTGDGEAASAGAGTTGGTTSGSAGSGSSGGNTAANATGSGTGTGSRATGSAGSGSGGATASGGSATNTGAAPGKAGAPTPGTPGGSGHTGSRQPAVRSRRSSSARSAPSPASSGPCRGPAPPAIRAWAAYMNAKGGINGHPVRVILGDDNADPARTLALVRQMVERDKVIAFFNDYSFTLAAATRYLEEKQIPVIGSIGGDVAGDHSPMVFHPLVGPDKGQAWGFLLTIATQTDKKKLGLIYCREAATCAVQMGSFKKLLPWNGLESVYEAQVSLAQPDYTGRDAPGTAGRRRGHRARWSTRPAWPASPSRPTARATTRSSPAPTT